jgi:hypothetical protein
MTTRATRTLIVIVFAGLGLAAPARAQAPAGGQLPPAAPIELKAQDAVPGLKYHASFQISTGFDLDVLGNIINGALGTIGTSQIAIRQARPYPDIYVTVPKRSQVTAGFGVFQHDEIIGRISRATYTADPLTDAGNFAGAAGNETVAVAFSPYREKTWEVGWRRYFVMTRRAKQYANFLYGVRTVDPISGVFSVSGPEGTLGTARMYDRSKLKSFSLEVGLTYEMAHAGLYVEFGGRWQQKLKRIDDDLAVWGLQEANNTGIRFYMPLQFGVLFRL